ncbi:hypothetical protein QC762_406790 [Podospora pseudocomata]|uniref:Uncharacterized protein n=1 Tax=Podospora pseudocomata TaxID=2093779 RepID=A0ABR0GGK9_9PEZI|nr:hypothetical protein QC762_406790 [Podospora pseudocomata]
MISIIVGVLLLFFTGDGILEPSSQKDSTTQSPSSAAVVRVTRRKASPLLNPQGSLQEMGEHHGYDELDVPRVWYELDARSLRSLNRSLKWAMSGARSPQVNGGQNGGDIAPEVGVREGV